MAAIMDGKHPLELPMQGHHGCTAARSNAI
jgi:hypothetical protein